MCMPYVSHVSFSIIFCDKKICVRTPSPHLSSHSWAIPSRHCRRPPSPTPFSTLIRRKMPKRRESSESDDEIEKCSSVLTFVSDFFIIIIIIIFQLLAAQTKRRESSESESQPDQYIDRRDAANHLEAPCATNGIDPLALHPYRRQAYARPAWQASVMMSNQGT